MIFIFSYIRLRLVYVYMKIAFLFLTIDDIHFPHIWNKYFESVDKDKYSIYIHPKNPLNANWHNERIISELHPTEWGKITKAYIALLSAAFTDEDNQRFITISESCVPIRTFDALYAAIFHDNMSWIKQMKISKYDYSERLKIISDETGHVSNRRFMKHYARFCLIRNHVSILLFKCQQELEYFHSMHVGDEFFLSVLIPYVDQSEWIDRAITHDDWDTIERQKNQIRNRIKSLYRQIDKSDREIQMSSVVSEIKLLRDKFNNIAKSPKTIVNVNQDMHTIINCKSFFYRKFAKKSNIQRYWKYIITNSTSIE